jgi:two-component system, sensor histidine kinase and response regulator
VEDNAINQRLGALVLRKLGCRVTVASDGREAVEKACSGVYELIFMDYNLPELSGPGAAAEIRRRGITVPIVALTASILEDTRRVCFDAGMNDFLAKPFQQASITAALARWTKPAQPEEAAAAPSA